MSLIIINQKNILQKYAFDNGFSNTRFFVDDGYSGTNFERPDWQRLIKLAEDGKISTVIVKDMSRLGRNYLKLGYAHALPNHKRESMDKMEAYYEKTLASE